jgi:hypothetical protein
MLKMCVCILNGNKNVNLSVHECGIFLLLFLGYCDKGKNGNDVSQKDFQNLDFHGC